MLREGTYLQERYEILELIGSGGMSDVYKAKCHKLNRLVAIKVLKEEFSNDAGFVSKFKMEAQAAACLSHPNIVNIYDVVDEGNLHYIVMELIEGITLKSYIGKKGKLEIKEAVGIAIQVAQGIAAAHEQNIIHRDIKPQNMIISRDGKVKVADFGIARAATSQTMTVSAMGSVHYISPEQARGGYSDTRSDIYSLGVTLYEMVTGRVPFEGDNTVTVALAHLEEPITRPSIYNPEVPVSLENIILKCTEKKPERRYSYVTDVIADLRRVLIHPDENFVTFASEQDFGGETVTISARELEAIKKGQKNYQSGNRDAQNYGGQPEDRWEAEQNLGNSQNRGVGQKRISSQNRVGGQGRQTGQNRADYPTRNSGQNRKAEKRKELSHNSHVDEDTDDVNPKIEKIMTAVGVFVAILIVALLIFVFSKLGGIFRIGSGISNPTTTVEPETTIQADTSETLDDTEILMPDATNLPMDMAEAKLKESTLVMRVAGYEDSETVEKGYVIRQVIPEGTVVKRYSTVDVIVSNGTDLVDLSQLQPNLVGMESEAAKLLLEQKKLVPVLQQEYSDTVPEGKVSRYEPEKAREGETVTIYISAGSVADMRTVPDLYNISEDEAIGRLADAELNPGEATLEYSDEIPFGNVIRQDVEANTMVKVGTTVSYVVSQGHQGKRYVGAISETYHLSDLIGPGAAESSLEVEIRLRQEVDGKSVYKTLMQPKTLTGGDLLPVNFPSIEGVSGIEYGEVEIVNMQTGFVIKSYPIKFFETE